MSIETIYESVLRGDAPTAKADTQAELDAGASAEKSSTKPASPP